MPAETAPESGTEQPVESKDVDFVSKTEYTKLQQETERLHRLVQDLNKDRESLNHKLESFGELTPEEVSELKNQVRDFRAKDAGGDPEQLNAIWQEKETEIRGEFGKQLETVRTTNEKLAAELHELKVTSKVMDEFGGSVNDDMRAFVKQQVAKSVDIDKHTGHFVVKDDKGEIRYQANDPSKRMTVDDLFTELEGRYPSAFRPKGINKGSVGAGQQIQAGTPSNFGNIDLERFAKDAAYRESIPRAQRARLYDKLGL